MSYLIYGLLCVLSTFAARALYEMGIHPAYMHTASFTMGAFAIAIFMEMGDKND